MNRSLPAGVLARLCALALAFAAPLLAEAGDVVVAQREGVLGTSFEMRVAAAPGIAQAAIDAALQEVARLEAELSTWREDSPLSAYNRGALAYEALPIDVAAVLALCEEWKQRSDDAFSCRLGGFRSQWHAAQDGGALPDRIQLRRTARAVAAQDEPATGTLDPASPLRFDVDGIAKGYIVDRALAAARAAAPDAAGIAIDIGGDGVYWGVDDAGEPWRVGIADPGRPLDNGPPLAEVRLSGQAIAASGHRSRGYRIGRRQFSHILDPLEGWPVVFAPGATVVADDAATADALATTLTVLPIRDGLALVDRTPGAAALIVADGGVAFASSRWPALLDGRATVAGDTPAWQIEYEIPQPAQRERYRQPYLALWIERLDGSPVRQLHVLGDRARWLNELPRWWRQYGRGDAAGALALARPTRAPGHYSLAWDGRDDLGRTVAPGKYVLRIEAAREHGGREDLSLTFDTSGALAGAGQSVAGRSEVGALVLRRLPGAPGPIR